MRRHQVRSLLMGGQACIIYGAAEFSRDTDLAVMPDQDTLERLILALKELQAECIAVPPFRREFLERGHAVHFRCAHEAVRGMRIDIMARMRGVDAFPELWERRRTFALGEGDAVDVMGLPDLVQAKKTQRDKDWPMLRRLLEADYLANRQAPPPGSLLFWLRELRTPSLLREVAREHPAELRRVALLRPLLGRLDEEDARVEQALADEEAAERRADREYWEPLRKELEKLRHSRPHKT